MDILLHRFRRPADMHQDKRDILSCSKAARSGSKCNPLMSLNHPGPGPNRFPGHTRFVGVDRDRNISLFSKRFDQQESPGEALHQAQGL